MCEQFSSSNSSTDQLFRAVTFKNIASEKFKLLSSFEPQLLQSQQNDEKAARMT
jgi:hypothetical protein